MEVLRVVCRPIIRNKLSDSNTSQTKSKSAPKTSNSVTHTMPNFKMTIELSELRIRSYRMKTFWLPVILILMMPHKIKLKLGSNTTPSMHPEHRIRIQLKIIRIREARGTLIHHKLMIILAICSNNSHPPYSI